jgi:hypothetical protein
LRDFAASFGFPATQFTDDTAFARALLGAAQQGAQAQQAFLAMQRQMATGGQVPAAAQPPAQPKSLIEAKPPYDPRWPQMLEKDPLTGGMRPKAGAPPDLLQRIGEYNAWREQFADALITDPMGTLQPIINQQVEKLVEQRMGQANQSQTIGRIQAANEGWLFAKNPQGQYVTDFSGRRSFTPEGQLYVQFLKDLGDAGVADPERQHSIAISMVKAKLLDLQQSQAGLQQQNVAGQQAALAAVNNGGGLQLPGRNGAGVGSGEGVSPADRSGVGLTLREQMQQAMRQVPDAAVQWADAAAANVGRGF